MVANKGKKIRKYQCFVLCLKANIPMVEPSPPPKIAIRNRVDSGILHSFLFARRLSIPMNIKPITDIVM